MIGPVVGADWWRAHADGSDDARTVLADVRWYLDGRSGREAYERGHLPGAVFVDVDRTLAAPGSPEHGRHPLPPPEVFAEGMADAGIGDDDVVVAYDDAGGVVAARLVWMLRATGHEAALLDGGLTVHDPQRDGPLSTGVVARPRARFTPRPWPTAQIVELDEVVAGGLVLLDARDGVRYRGETEPVDPRAGHVPGALSAPCRENLGPAGRLLPVELLRERFAAVGVTDAAGTVSYCGSGINACHNLLVMEHAGLGRGRLWPGSWSQYSHRADLPAATD